MKFTHKMISISCLPKAGEENPYQVLMMKGLAVNRCLSVQYGIDKKILGLLRTMIQQKPDFIHLDWETKYYYRKNLLLTIFSLPFFFFEVTVIRYFSRTKIVWTPHNVIPHNAKHLLVHRISRRFLGRCATWVRIFSAGSKEEFVQELRISAKKIRVVPEGDYISYYPNNISKNEARANLRIPSHKRVLLYFGMIRPYKGILELISAFNDADLPETLLVIAGFPRDSNYFKLVEEESRNNKNIVVYGRYIDTKEVQLYFNAADVVVLPFNKVENSGSVILAMGFKKPVIAPSVGTVAHRLRNQQNLLYSDNLAGALMKLNSYSSSVLAEMGVLNFSTLDQTSWTDFQKCFLEYNEDSSLH